MYLLARFILGYTYVVTVELVHLSTERYHCLSMEGRWRATAQYTVAHSASISG